MNMLTIAVCEDTQDDQKLLLELIQKTGIPSNCNVFSCGEDFLAAFQPEKFDAVFMDIYMGGMTGVETISRLRRIDEAVPVAFVTTSRDHTLEGYRLDVLKYIEKPVLEKDVREFLKLAQLKRQTIPHLYIRQNGKTVGIPFSRILCAEQKGHELLLHLTGGETISLNDRLDVLEPQFDGQNFFRCHKSYLVNLAHIKALDQELKVFLLDDGNNVYIRRESMSRARKAYETYLFHEARRSAHEHE